MLSVHYLWKTCGENVLLARNLPTVKYIGDSTHFLQSITNYATIYLER